jgi:hypothetical protein
MPASLREHTPPVWWLQQQGGAWPRGTVKRSQRECEDGKSKSASKDTDGKDEGGSHRLESEERHGHQG